MEISHKMHKGRCLEGERLTSCCDLISLKIPVAAPEGGWSELDAVTGGVADVN